MTRYHYKKAGVRGAGPGAVPRRPAEAKRGQAQVGAAGGVPPEYPRGLPPPTCQQRGERRRTYDPRCHIHTEVRLKERILTQKYHVSKRGKAWRLEIYVVKPHFPRVFVGSKATRAERIVYTSGFRLCSSLS